MADEEETETPAGPSDDERNVIKGMIKEAFTEFLNEYEPPKPKTNRPKGGMLETVFGIGK